MAYCRASKECDLFCYRSNSNTGSVWVTHVANVGGHHGNKTFTDDNLPDFLARLLSLRADGYLVPEETLERVRAEIEGMKK